MPNHPDALRAFLDIESTGLDASTCHTLEVGIVIVDQDFNEKANFSVLVASTENRAWARDTSEMHDHGRDDELNVAQRMHLDNGLIGDLLTAKIGPHSTSCFTAYSYDDAAVHLCAFLDEHGITEPVPLAGSSVRSLDGPFLAHHMPALYGRFTHRTIDASALTELAEFLDPDGLKKVLDGVPRSGHRVIGDCRRSIEIVQNFATHYGIGAIGSTPRP